MTGKNWKAIMWQLHKDLRDQHQDRDNKGRDKDITMFLKCAQGSI